MNKETIHIENLSIGYPGKGDVKVVADGICAGINSGELTCLLGANGVGKSTLLRTLSAFQPKLGGNIFIEGKEIGDYTDKQLSRVISVVLTEKCDIRNMSVVEVWGVAPTPVSGELFRKRTRLWWTNPSPWSAFPTWQTAWCIR